MNAGRSIRPLLAKGDIVGVVTPGFAVRAASLRAGVDRLRAWGYRVVVGKHALSRFGYLAGDDDRRAQDLNAMIADPDVRAIWFSRGGYGSSRLLEKVRWRALARREKTLVGYSDVTALFSTAIARSGTPCLYGPPVAELGEPGAYHLPSLRDALRGESITLRFGKRQTLSAGRAEGVLQGGNLTVLTHLLGTRFAPRLDGAILFLEDVGEPVYRLDRMLQQMRLSRSLDRVSAVVLGSFDPAKRRTFPPDRSLRDVLGEALSPLGVPVVTDLPCGHLPKKRTLPLGGRARLDTRAGRLEIDPPRPSPTRP